MYKINDYKIELYDCRNGHNIKNILLNEYEKTQCIDGTKLICDKCKEQNKSNTYNNEFYKCIKCNKNISTLCKTKNNNNNHIIINYENKNYICKKHNEFFTKYCCNENICIECHNEHKNHNSIYFGDILPNIIDNNL